MRIDAQQHFSRYIRDDNTMTSKPVVDAIRFSRVLLLLALSVFIVGAIQQMNWLARPAYADLR